MMSRELLKSILSRLVITVEHDNRLHGAICGAKPPVTFTSSLSKKVNEQLTETKFQHEQQ
jgi:hypothetical protein